MIITNAHAQSVFAQAIELVPDVNIDISNPSVEDVKTQMVKTILIYLKMFTASSNDNPVLRGLGFEEGFALAEKIIETGGNIATVKIDSKSLGKAMF